MGVTKIYPPLNNYIYLYHTDTLLYLPTYPENITDNTSIAYSNSTPLGRSAPIYSYSSSGPRSMQFSFRLHREQMNQVNTAYISSGFPNAEDDYVDLFIKQIQAAALPKYSSSQKMIDPPVVAVRLANEIFIKGVITNGVGVTYQLPILKSDKYAIAEVSFSVNEITPYDADLVMQIGSYRDTGDVPMNLSLERLSFKLPKSTGRVTSARI